ncbi:ATP-dependent helicase HrpB [Nitrospira sp. NS4]|uniref:ATP-dependent helicase HrpB n=1 Tax=Nitrospira sp. NS4 TaxID=3414498 RepID=UPI003C2E8954
MSRLPIEDVLPAVSAALSRTPNVVLTAPPGAGKTTGVPPALLGAPWLGGKKVLLLEPRRLAARAAAHRMATQRQETVGETVGYRMRLDTKVGPNTRIEVVTEGILTRLLQHDPSLNAYGAVLFDEFHERSLQADTGLALCLESQRLFRPDLRLLVMSATLDVDALAALLDRAPVIACEGRMFPVETRYLDQPLTGHLDKTVTQIIRRSLAQDSGSLLVFLPGMAEIRRVERTLLDAALGPKILVAPLHGDLSQAAQDLAIAPAPAGTRKIVLATSIAETSLTIDGVRVVIDAGLLRVPRFDPRTGLTRLETIHVTQDSADQRRGRAGRLEPGVCYRLWTASEQTTLTPRRPPEVLDADLAPLMLDLALWGTADPSELSWLTPPPAGTVAQAKDLLTRLGALDAGGAITAHGRRMADLPIHPRLAHMLLKSIPLHLTSLACDLAALLSERDLLRGPPGGRNADLRLRLDILHGAQDHAGGGTIDRVAGQRIRRTADLWRYQLARLSGTQPTEKRHEHDAAGMLLALAYPDRIAQRQPGPDRRYRLANGRGAVFPNPDPLATEEFLVIAGLDGATQWARIDLAAPVAPAEIEQLYQEDIRTSDSVVWDEKTQAVRATRQRQLWSLVLSEQSLSKPEPSLIAAALLQGIKQKGLDQLAWTPELQHWRARVQFVRRMTGPDSSWPDLSNEHLLQTLDEWLGPYLDGITTLERVKRLDLATPLHALLTWEQQRQLERLAPAQMTVPSGSQVRLDYESSDLPVLAVRLQEMFGCTDTPRVLEGKVPVTLHLLSPARRPVQVTKDLASFWKSAYVEVKKELRGRYPKHHWPDDPLTAPPTAKAKRRAS